MVLGVELVELGENGALEVCGAHSQNVHSS